MLYFQGFDNLDDFSSCMSGENARMITKSRGPSYKVPGTAAGDNRGAREEKVGLYRRAEDNRGRTMNQWHRRRARAEKGHACQEKMRE